MCPSEQRSRSLKPRNGEVGFETSLSCAEVLSLRLSASIFFHVSQMNSTVLWTDGPS